MSGQRTSSRNVNAAQIVHATAGTVGHDAIGKIAGQISGCNFSAGRFAIVQGPLLNSGVDDAKIVDAADTSSLDAVAALQLLRLSESLSSGVASGFGLRLNTGDLGLGSLGLAAKL